MATDYKGLTINFGGDMTDLQKALREIKKGSNETSSALKDINKALDFDTKNVTLLAQKERELKNAIDDTKKKIDAYKQGLEQLNQKKKNGESLTDKEQRQYDQLQRTLMFCERELDQYNQELAETQQVSREAAAGLDKVESAIDRVGDEAKTTKSEIDGINTKLDESASKAETFKSKMSNVSRGLATAGAVTAPLTAGIVAFGKESVEAASDYEESLSKVEQVFGQSAGSIKEWSETASENFGMNSGSALEMTSLFGDYATSMDIASEDAAEMSKTLAGLSADLASFKNSDLDQASHALTGIFTGETESLKSLGINMTQDALQAYAISSGFVKAEKSAVEVEKQTIAVEKAQNALNTAIEKYGENSIEAREAANKLAQAEQTLATDPTVNINDLSQAEKVMLRYNYVMEKTALAQGDYARTADGTANSLRTFNETVEELKISIGEELLPVITPIIQSLTDILKGFSELDPETKKMIITIAGIVAAISPVLFLLAGLTSGIGALGGALSFLAANPIALVVGAIAAIVGGIATWIATTEEGREFFEGFCQFVSDAFGAVVDFIVSIPERVSQAFSDLINIITSPFIAAFNAIVDFWNDTLGNWHVEVPDWVPGIGGQSFGFQKIQKIYKSVDSVDAALANGGIVNRPTTALIGEGGESEVVSPLSSLQSMLDQAVRNAGAGDGVTVNVTVNARTDNGAKLGDTIGRAVRSQIKQTGRRGGYAYA